MTAPAGQPTQLARIGLWGAPQSGKTTFLAALNIAAISQPTTPGGPSWIVIGGDDDAGAFLSENTDLLQSRHVFPSATPGLTALSWRFIGPARGGRRAGRPLRRGPRPENTVFAVELLDAPDEWELLLDHLSRCDGLVYLFDPVREERNSDAYEFFQRTLEQVTRRCFEANRLRGGKLPHFLAVCVTKFDEPAVFRQAFRTGVVLTGDEPERIPRVPDNLAKTFFDRLCDEGHEGSARLVRGSINTFFHPDRISYFVSSSVGFHIGPSGYFRAHDFANVVKTSGEARIRGAIRPINVLEPFLWLEESTRSAPRRR
ncbi:hypothetical protein FF36_03991 [Frankia torreyi]|uniref:Uncharacterized protein n=1 Tax=Frankia torreyi TaxID=1856 RepID=A0A0D8BE16_9ACTN|nr:MULTISPECIES: hypothetical protein [Frankia]KJE21657.1 hypothetical protein FF36_03991 [Frankia torreyi]KQM03775.1 hypothetical protein FF86_103550 [Frankia sp. CpI1-P]